ncbi:hypothetical protein RCL1_002576 [Eukaryota sp. TZLM3-RCL]
MLMLHHYFSRFKSWLFPSSLNFSIFASDDNVSTAFLYALVTVLNTRLLPTTMSNFSVVSEVFYYRRREYRPMTSSFSVFSRILPLYTTCADFFVFLVDDSSLESAQEFVNSQMSRFAEKPVLVISTVPFSFPNATILIQQRLDLIDQSSIPSIQLFFTTPTS